MGRKTEDTQRQGGGEKTHNDTEQEKWTQRFEGKNTKIWMRKRYTEIGRKIKTPQIERDCTSNSVRDIRARESKSPNHKRCAVTKFDSRFTVQCHWPNKAV